MSSFMESLQKRRLLPAMPPKDDLPVSQATSGGTHMIGLRKRLSSFSVNVQPLSASSSSSSWAFRKSRSMPSLGEFSGGPLRRWWDRSWAWLLSRKPSFARNLELNEEETAMLGGWRHAFCKLRSEFRKLYRSQTLPTTTTQGFRYDSFSYAQNFDDGKKKKGEE